MVGEKVQCYNCNNIYNDYLGYCPYCGVKKEEFNVCSNCGEKLTKDFLICPKCGGNSIEETNEMKSDRLNQEGLKDNYYSRNSINYFNESIKFNKNNIDAWVNKSKTLNNLTTHEAIKCCEAGLKINKDNMNLLLAKIIAIKKDSRGNNEENNINIMLSDLLKRCNQELQDNKLNDNLWILKGEILYELDNRKESIKCYSNALGLNPNNERLWVRKAELCYLEKDYISELESYKKALELNPTNAKYYETIGDTYENYIGDSERAIEYYINSLELNPNYGYLWTKKGDLEEKIGKYDEAIESFNVAAKLSTTQNNNLLRKAEMLCKLNRFEEAIECYDDALKISSDPYSMDLKAKLLIDLGKYEDALKVYDDNINKNPIYDGTYLKKGNLLKELGRFEEAVKCYEVLLNKDDYNPTDYKRAQLCKAIALLEINKEKAENYFNELLEDCNRSLEIFPDSADYWERKADILYFSGNLEDAYKCYDRTLKCEYVHKEIIIASKAKILYDLKKYEEAIAMFNESLEIYEHFYALEYKGYCLEELNKYSEAMDCYNKCLEIDPRNKIILSKKSELSKKLNEVDGI